MGLSHEQHHELLKNLNPRLTEPVEAKPEVQVEDATIGNEERLRGIPAVGRVSGTIKGTRPGDRSSDLEEAGRDILRAHLHRNRYRRGQA